VYQQTATYRSERSIARFVAAHGQLLVTASGQILGSNEPYCSRALLGMRLWWGWLMDAYGTARLAAKEAESAIVGSDL